MKTFRCDHYIQNHRCEGSVKNGVSVRRYENYAGHVVWSAVRWQHDLDYDCYIPQEVEHISFCPFCGKELYQGEIPKINLKEWL